MRHPARGHERRPEAPGRPHAHAVELSADNRFAFVPELGGDKVMIYELDAEKGKLTPNKNQPFIKMAPGAGPRQLVMHPNGKFAYLINELNSTMTSYGYDASKGTLTEIQTLPTLPKDFSGYSSAPRCRCIRRENSSTAPTAATTRSSSTASIGEAEAHADRT